MSTLPFQYLIFNKPFNVLCQFTPGDAQLTSGPRRKTLADFISTPDVYPVGRLDLDSEGLLLLSDDGNFQHRVSTPRYAHPRTYWAQVEGLVTLATLTQLEEGIAIQDYRTLPAKAHVIDEPDLPPRTPPIRCRQSIPTSWLELVLVEGRNRQVRRMTAAVGFPTLRLIRAGLGSLTLCGLAPGEWRHLTAAEVEQCVKSERSAPRLPRRPTAPRSAR